MPTSWPSTIHISPAPPHQKEGLLQGYSSARYGTEVYPRERETLLVFGKINDNRGFVGLQDNVQHRWDFLGRGLGWGGIKHTISDSDECREKGSDNIR
jgi:hypothetical protein